MHPYNNVSIVAGYNTQQARRLEKHTSLSITLDAVRGVLDTAGLPYGDVDMVLGDLNGEVTYALGLGPAMTPPPSMVSISNILFAADAIACKRCNTVLLAGGAACIYSDDAPASYTLSSAEFIEPFGLTTPMEFALIARRHMEMYGTTQEQLATVSATIRNNGHVNPDAVYFDKGPYTPEQIIASRLIAEPFHLLDCAITSEGGAALLLTSSDMAKDLDCSPVYILGGGVDRYGPIYQNPPSWDLRGQRNHDTPLGNVGRRAARKSFAMAGIETKNVDICEFYDPFPSEIIRQFESFGFCEDGEGGAFVMDGNISVDGRFPTTTDGGLQSFSAVGGSVQFLQRVIRGLHQLQECCKTNQIKDAETAMCTNAGAGGYFNEVILLGRKKP